MDVLYGPFFNVCEYVASWKIVVFLTLNFLLITSLGSSHHNRIHFVIPWPYVFRAENIVLKATLDVILCLELLVLAVVGFEQNFPLCFVEGIEHKFGLIDPCFLLRIPC